MTNPARRTCQERVWDEVWKKRIAYFAAVGASLILLALPLLQRAWPPGACEAWLCSQAPQIAAAGAFIPDFLPGPPMPTLWTDAFSRQPLLSLILAVAVAIAYFWGMTLQQRIHDRMRKVWTEALAPPVLMTPVTATGQPDDTWIRRLRTSKTYQGIFRTLKWWIVPWAFGLGILWAGITLVTWALLSLAEVVGLGPQMPALVPWPMWAVSAVATLILIIVAERSLICRWLVNLFRRPRRSSAGLSTG